MKLHSDEVELQKGRQAAFAKRDLLFRCGARKLLP